MPRTDITQNLRFFSCSYKSIYFYRQKEIDFRVSQKSDPVGIRVLTIQHTYGTCFSPKINFCSWSPPMNTIDKGDNGQMRSITQWSQWGTMQNLRDNRYYILMSIKIYLVPHYHTWLTWGGKYIALPSWTVLHCTGFPFHSFLCTL